MCIILASNDVYFGPETHEQKTAKSIIINHVHDSEDVDSFCAEHEAC